MFVPQAFQFADLPSFFATLARSIHSVRRKHSFKSLGSQWDRRRRFERGLRTQPQCGPGSGLYSSKGYSPILLSRFVDFLLTWTSRSQMARHVPPLFGQAIQCHHFRPTYPPGSVGNLREHCFAISRATEAYEHLHSVVGSPYPVELCLNHSPSIAQLAQIQWCFYFLNRGHFVTSYMTYWNYPLGGVAYTIDPKWEWPYGLLFLNWGHFVTSS